MLWHHGAAVHRKRVNVRKRSKMLALANGSLIEMHTPRHWALTYGASERKRSIGNIYQTFAGQELYPSLEEKAAHLLYFVTKNHSFLDGNKRIAATMFLYFLDKNGVLFIDDEKMIDDHTLVALTIMIAESKPEEKEMMITVIMNCLRP